MLPNDDPAAANLPLAKASDVVSEADGGLDGEALSSCSEPEEGLVGEAGEAGDQLVEQPSDDSDAETLRLPGKSPSQPVEGDSSEEDMPPLEQPPVETPPPSEPAESSPGVAEESQPCEPEEGDTPSSQGDGRFQSPPRLDNPPDREELVEMCIGLMQFLSTEHPDIMKCL